MRATLLIMLLATGCVANKPYNQNINPQASDDRPQLEVSQTPPSVADIDDMIKNRKAPRPEPKPSKKQ